MDSEQVGRTRVWFIATERASEDQERIRRAVEEHCDENGWIFSMRRSLAQRVTGGIEKDRPYRALSPRDAAQIYQDLHLNRCLVVATHSCYIKGDPSRDPVAVKAMLALQDFVAYKAAFALARGASDAVDALNAFESWPEEAACLGHHDPRTLPLHVFDPYTCWRDLNSERQRPRFDQHYRRREGTRTDSAGRGWQPPNGMHGAAGAERSVLTVAGHPLSQGFHWDVQRGRGKARLTTESEVWMLEFARAYMNIYPNGYVRGEPRRGAKRVWPRT